MARAQVHERAARAEHPLEQHLDAPAGRLAPDDARRQHARVVEDEQVAGAQELRQLGEQPILDGARGAVEHEQTARAPLGERHLRDQLRPEARSGNRCAASGRDSSGPVARSLVFWHTVRPLRRAAPFVGSVGAAALASPGWRNW